MYLCLEVVGFPIPYIGFLSMEGYLFVLTSPIVLPKFTYEKKLSLKKLPTSGLSGYGVIYAYNEKNELVFLYSNGKRNAIRYDIEEDEHREIKSSKAIDKRGNDPISLRMGIHLWIIGGTDHDQDFHTEYMFMNYNTTFWVQFSFQIGLTKK
jgi:hypothetical protein